MEAAGDGVPYSDVGSRPTMAGAIVPPVGGIELVSVDSNIVEEFSGRPAMMWTGIRVGIVRDAMDEGVGSGNRGAEDIVVPAFACIVVDEEAELRAFVIKRIAAAAGDDGNGIQAL